MELLYSLSTLDRLERITAHARKLSDAYTREKVKKERDERDAEQRRLAAEFGDTQAVVEHAQAVASTRDEAARIQAKAPKIADVARVRADEGTGMSTAKALEDPMRLNQPHANMPRRPARRRARAIDDPAQAARIDHLPRSRDQAGPQRHLVSFVNQGSKPLLFRSEQLLDRFGAHPVEHRRKDREAISLRSAANGLFEPIGNERAGLQRPDRHLHPLQPLSRRLNQGVDQLLKVCGVAAQLFGAVASRRASLLSHLRSLTP